MHPSKTKHVNLCQTIDDGRRGKCLPTLFVICVVPPVVPGAAVDSPIQESLRELRLSLAQVRGLEHALFEETPREVSFSSLEKTEEGSPCCLHLPRMRF